jgi:protein-tyrosine kinase
MSKIEKALDRAKQNRGMAIVKKPKTDPDVSETRPNTYRDSFPAKNGGYPVSHKKSADAIAMMKESALRAREDLASVNTISPDVSENPTVQAFRDIRTRILQHTQGRNGMVLVTAATRHGGGSFVARNLAVAFAFDAGRTSLLIDCDLRNRGLQSLLYDTDSAGITDYLDNANLSIGDIIHPVGIERLRVIPAGSRHDVPTEYFISDRVRQLFGEIRDRYPERIVILDAPPVIESADTRILVDYCDYVILVVPYGKLTNRQIDSCIKSIDSQKLIGVVFNNEPWLPPLNLNIHEMVNQLRMRLMQFIEAKKLSLLALIKGKKLS